ncbi:gag protein [Ditylenchus destructor]|uniref:Gag protein n=1 Tax=Ditylenchus destructor TaxID=166010 RepID=A0AAD4MLT4_9BILA|nr:gag protein [Ditylenchus destructor]
MSAPFRQLIGPAKSRLHRYTTEVDDLLLDNRPEDEDQHLFSEMPKYTRLLSLLYGEAEQLVKGYPYSAEAYPLVIDALKEEYGQTSVLAENLQAELMTMPQAQDNAESLKKTSQAIDRICRQMKLLGHSDEHPLLATTIK